MAIDYHAYRTSEKEHLRIKDLFHLIPERGRNVLDIGARDGFLSLKLAERFDQVVALDIEKPNIDHQKIECVRGNASHLDYPDHFFDTVICAEVLEHIPCEILSSVCEEISRVAERFVVIGVPYRQDTRFGKTTCSQCGRTNPPWVHVNSFDENSLRQKFPRLKVRATSFVGSTLERTNSLSAALMQFAGNPYGTYSQEEPCVFCGSSLGGPVKRSLIQKVATRIATTTESMQRFFESPRPNWIHILFEK